MANLPESDGWADGVYQIETSDPVLGGPEGIANQQAKQLAGRTRWLKNKVDGFIDGTLSVAKAVKLATARTISISGAGTGSAGFDGSSNVTIALTLNDTGISAATYTRVAVNAKGLVTAGSGLSSGDIPNLDWGKITSGKPTTLAGYGITDAVATQESLKTWARKFVGVGVGVPPGPTYIVPPSHAGMWINCTTPGSVITLPAANTIPDGATFLFRNAAGNAAVTLSYTGNINSSVSGNTLVLGPYEWVELAYSGVTYWVVGRGTTAATDSLRVGEVTHFAMSTPPPGFLKRNGAAVSRTTYAALFEAIGTRFGAGDGSTTFNVPDSRGYFDRGWDDGRNIDPNRVLGSDQASQNLLHSHSATAVAGGAHVHTTSIPREYVPPTVTTANGTDVNAVYGDQVSEGYGTIQSSSGGTHTHTIMVGDSGGAEARPVNTAFLACIKY